MVTQKRKLKIISNHYPRQGKFQYKVEIRYKGSLAEIKTQIYNDQSEAYEDAMRVSAGLMV